MKTPLLPALFRANADKYEERTAVHYRDYSKEQWIPISWRKLAADTFDVAKALFRKGVKVQENVGIFSQNMPEILVSEFALFQNRAVSVPMYATSTAEQIEYIIKDATISTIFVGEQKQYDIAYEVLCRENPLAQIVVYTPEVRFNESDTSSCYFSDLIAQGSGSSVEKELEERTNSVQSSDLATLIYTSGTTGEPKGVMLDYDNYECIFEPHRQRLPQATEGVTSMAFLPMSHIFEKAWSYFCLVQGMEIYINLYPQDIQKTIKEVRPQVMCSVPRFWEKVYEGVQDKIASSEGIMQKMMLTAVEVGFEYNINYKRLGIKPPMALELKYKFFQKTVFAKLKKVVGIDNGTLFPCAGSPLSDKICQFLISCGIPICYGYGLTETTATVSCFEMEGYEFGTVGKVMPGLEVRIGENDEIEIRGGSVHRGYYKKPDANAQAFTVDGFFKTGDAGSIDRFGILKVTDRIKDLFKTSNGKYIAPQALEMAIVADPLIEQVVTIGDNRKYVTALIVPAKEAITAFALKHQIPTDNYPTLLKNLHLQELLKERIDKALSSFASFEQIKRFTLIPELFTMEKGELTNTLKIKRKIINEHYKKEIEIMYL